MLHSMEVKSKHAIELTVVCMFQEQQALWQVCHACIVCCSTNLKVSSEYLESSQCTAATLPARRAAVLLQLFNARSHE